MYLDTLYYVIWYKAIKKSLGYHRVRVVKFKSRNFPSSRAGEMVKMLLSCFGYVNDQF